MSSSGDRDLDILFSDHQMTVSTLKQFGAVIRQIAEHSVDPEIRSWAFISYVSAHPAQLLSATPPPEIAGRVQALLSRAQLPIVPVKLKTLPKETGPPPKTISFPDVLFHKYSAANNFHTIERVQVRRKDGVVVDGVLTDMNGSREFLFHRIELNPKEIVAIRTAPGCLFGWFIKPKWVEIGETT